MGNSNYLFIIFSDALFKETLTFLYEVPCKNTIIRRPTAHVEYISSMVVPIRYSVVFIRSERPPQGLQYTHSVSCCLLLALHIEKALLVFWGNVTVEPHATCSRSGKAAF